MTQTSLFNPIHRSRILEHLHEFELLDEDLSHVRFGEHLAKLVEFSDSFALSDAHYYISKMTSSNDEVGELIGQRAEEIVNEFMRVRGILVRTIVKSFYPDARTRFKLPRPRVQDDVQEALNYEPYRRFYAIQQREMDGHIENLRQFVRDTISDMSLSLKKLAALDKAMSKLLQGYANKQLTQIPRMLEGHYKRLQQEHLNTQSNIEDWLKEDGWLSTFYRDFQATLLAELDFRLLPVTAMIESLNEEVNKQHD